MPTNLVFCDTETGGLSPDTDALLSIGLADWQDGVIGETCEILVDPEGLRCTPKALEVNHIDLDVHCGYSVPRSEAARMVRDWCRPRGRVMLGGHNVNFDIGFLQRLFAPGMWGMSFSYRYIDTLQVLGFLEHAGLIPAGIGKLEQATEHFGIEVAPGKRHTALADAIASARVYTAALDLMRRKVA